MKIIKIRKELDYHLDIPKRMEKYDRFPTKIRIKFVDGEYQYILRKHTFCNGTNLTSDELDLISKRLKELNNK